MHYDCSGLVCREDKPSLHAYVLAGVTAKDWIDRATITLAKVMLRHTTKNISQISDELHFPNDSFFCKYFKRLTGHTPLGWRNGA